MRARRVFRVRGGSALRCGGLLLRGIVCRRRKRVSSVVASEVVAFDPALEVAEVVDGKSLGGGGLFDGQVVITLHRAIDGDIFFDLRGWNALVDG